MTSPELELFTEFAFNSAHFIPEHEGKCRRLHGHSYLCKIWIRGDLGQLDKKTGILFDFNKVDSIKELLCHYNLNEIMEKPPSAENTAVFIYHKLHEISEKELLFKVKVYESHVLKKSSAKYGDFE